MGYEDEDWLTVALQDGSLVAELLLSLRHAPPSRKQNKPAPPEGLQVEWTVRQPRSKAPFKDNNNNDDNNTAKKQKKVECGAGASGGGSNRASPTTPLSWSGGGGTESSGGDGFEESSSMPSNKTRDNARSKLKITTTTPGSISTVGAKRPRRKKTLAELKEEECLLLKERRNLKLELADLKARFEKERATNDRLKRLKLDLQGQKATTAEMAEQHESVKAVSDPDTIPLESRESPDASMQQCSTLPDLNVLPDLNQLPQASEFDVL